MIIVAKHDLELLYANSAAQRLAHPVRLRRGKPLPDVWSGFSLRKHAARLFHPGVVPEGRVEPEEDRTIVISGISTRDQETAALLLEDVSAKERRRRAEREFVANAAHELLTPLTGIVGAAHVLQSGAKEVPEDRDKFIAHIARECDRLARIARALLVLARAQSGEHPPRLEVVPLRDLLDDAVAISTAETDAAISVECTRDLTVFVDQDLFVQALVNLVANAAKHGGDRLYLRAARSEAGPVGIEVVDQNARLSSDELRRMEQRFYSRAGRDGGGFGLGLSIARQSVEALGGTLTLGLREQEGLHARIEVPAGEPAAR